MSSRACQTPLKLAGANGFYPALGELSYEERKQIERRIITGRLLQQAQQPLVDPPSDHAYTCTASIGATSRLLGYETIHQLLNELAVVLWQRRPVVDNFS